MGIAQGQMTIYGYTIAHLGRVMGSGAQDGDHASPWAHTWGGEVGAIGTHMGGGGGGHRHTHGGGGGGP